MKRVKHCTELLEFTEKTIYLENLMKLFTEKCACGGNCGSKNNTTSETSKGAKEEIKSTTDENNKQN